MVILPAGPGRLHLHDIGKLVLVRFLDPALLQHLGEASAQGDMPVAQAELETLGFHHGELGGVLAQSQSA